MVTLEKARMIRNYLIYTWLAALAVLSGCNKTISSGGAVSMEAARGYDTTQYNLLYVDATRQKMLGNTGDAVVYFEQALKMNPSSDGACFQLSQISAMRGDLVSAARYGAKAAEIDGNNSWYLLNAASIYYMAGMKDSVIYYYEKVLALEPEREDLMFNLGNLYIERGHYDKAESIFTDFRNRYGDQGEIMLSLVNLYREKGNNDEAERLLQRMVEDEPDNPGFLGLLAEHYRHVNKKDEAIKVYGQLFEKDPDNELLQLSYLDFLITEKDYDGITRFINTVMINENVRIEDKISLFSAMLEDVELIRQAGRELELAAMVLQAANKDDAQATLMLVEVYEKVGSGDRVADVLKSYVNSDESNYFIWEKLLFALNAQGSGDELYNYSKRAATLFNRAPLPKLMLAFSATDREEFDLALGELGKVRILVNEQPEFMVQILMLEADIYYKREEFDRAFDSYEKALTYNPDDPLILNNYAYFLSEQGRELDKAYSMITRCLKIERNATYADTEAWILYKMGKIKRARKLMEEIEEKYGIDDPDLAEHYGWILDRSGDCQAAVKWWKFALEADNSRDYLNSEIARCVKGKQAY